MSMRFSPVCLNGQGENEENGWHVNQGGGVEAEREVRLVSPPGHVQVPQGVDTKLFFVCSHLLIDSIHVTKIKFE